MRPLLAALMVLPVFAGCFHAEETPALAHACPKVEGRSAGSLLWTLDTSVGIIVVDLCREQAPITVRHIVNLTQAGRYNGATFYRIVGPSEQSEKGFVIQGGLDRQAGTAPKVVDEFNGLLRHDREGTLSMAHAGPGSASSEFFITLDRTPHLDDRHAIFGYVVKGMDVVHKIARAPTESSPGNPNERSKPLETFTIRSATVSGHPDPAPLFGQVAAYTPRPRAMAGAGDAVNWPVVVRNLGTYVDNVTVALTGPAGWAVSVEAGRATQAVPAGRGAVFLVSALPPANATHGVYNLTATATSSRNASSTATVPLSVTVGPLGAQVVAGQKLEAHYIGMLPDGRIFDSSNEAVASDPALPKMATLFQYRGAGKYVPFNFTVGSDQTIAGFSKLALAGRIGETVTGRVPPEDAYAWRGSRPTVYDLPLVGKPLIFDLHILRVCTGNSTAC